MFPKRRTQDLEQISKQESVQGSGEAASLLQRTRESASGLLTDSFERPSPGVVTGLLASISTNSVKAGPSSGSKSTNESSLALGSSSQNELAISDRGESIRSTEKEGKFDRTHVQVEFDEFFARSDELEQEPDSWQDRLELLGDTQGSVTRRVAGNGLRQVQESKISKNKNEHEEFMDQRKDGAAVVALLSNPAFTVDEEPSSNLDLEGAGGRSYEKRQTGKGLAGFIDGLHPAKLLDLIPEFGAPWDPSHASLGAQKGIHERANFPESGFGELQPWIDILDMYHDEVWGEMLLPLVQAREERKAAVKKQTCINDGPAIRRLAMVLGHLGNPNHE